VWITESSFVHVTVLFVPITTFATLGKYELYCISTWATTELSVAFDGPLELVDKELGKQLTACEFVAVDEEMKVDGKETDEVIMDVEDEDVDGSPDGLALAVNVVEMMLVPVDWLLVAEVIELVPMLRAT
jgi:hypothetical protein